MRRAMKLLVLAGWISLLPGAAWAVEGVGVILEKNASNRSLLLNGTTWLVVSPTTVIRDKDGSLLTFEELPSGAKFAHGYKTVGDEAIEFEADDVNGALVARSIRVIHGNVD